MNRAVIVVSGVLLGSSLGLAIGGCGGYFECDNIDRPLTSGSYAVEGRSDYTFVLDLEGGSAVETYTEGVDTVRAEYSVGPVVAVH